MVEQITCIILCKHEPILAFHDIHFSYNARPLTKVIRYLPNKTKSIPPLIGVGMATNNAPNFPSVPKIIIIKPPKNTTLVLPT